jgi:hypothetical protein
MGRKVSTDSIADIFKGLFMINSPSPPLSRSGKVCEGENTARKMGKKKEKG